MLLGTLSASMLENMLTEKVVLEKVLQEQEEDIAIWIIWIRKF